MFDLLRKDKTFFDDFFGEIAGSKNALMKTDIKENDTSYTFEIDLPGFDKKDIKVGIENGYLTVSASKNDEVEEKKDNYIRRERHFGSFTRSFYVGNVKLDTLAANYKDGILSIDVPKEIKEETKYLEIK
ncbi:Hsp20/alpha crystallin family protein [Haploplasma axanthum]|uniref:Probable Hsp20 family chaperone n=1 Tax=Haploplasma axanthum TaxID=29552 RepID=A0A449BBP9_HAPAX|nr:Hsp20/alpha crystallin family protein [Haploplasma axanthum]VEU79865.1 Probable Hsp20 family chaperone [Haploplasma axanthum]